MSASHSKEVVYHEGDFGLSAPGADLVLEVGILDDLIQSRRNPRIQHLKIRDKSITLN